MDNDEKFKKISKTRKGTLKEDIIRPDAIPQEVKTRLRKLVIKNFRCIGRKPVTIDLDQIVVLVGPNNIGKSTILRAYQKITEKPNPELDLSDFPNNTVDVNNLPTVELYTSVVDNPPAGRWIDLRDGENIVRERWVWNNPGKGGCVREGFDVPSQEWVSQVPWGAPNVANARRPRPHHIEAFSSPEEQAGQIEKLLLDAIKAQISELPQVEIAEDGSQRKTSYGELIDRMGSLQKSVVGRVQDKIQEVESHLSQFVSEIFHGHEVKFDARPEEDLTKAFSFFKGGAQLQMGLKDGHFSPVQNQGSGARRTLMWAALKYLAEDQSHADGSRQNLLLLDEPELCLHPNAIREACNTLYRLSDGGSWQMMLTTHSPIFIDLSRDNTTVVRVERGAGDDVQSVTVFRPEDVNLAPDEKVQLKLINLYDPYVAEFFFGGKVILVEGDTEYTVFRYIIAQNMDVPEFQNVHIVRARGKVTLALLAKILNHFDARCSILHDADSPKTERLDREVRNPAWTNNQKIKDVVDSAKYKDRVRLIANLPDFEGAMFGTMATTDKPQKAYEALQSDPEAVKRVTDLLWALINHSQPLPDTCMEWPNLDALEEQLRVIAKAVQTIR